MAAVGVEHATRSTVEDILDQYLPSPSLPRASANQFFPVGEAPSVSLPALTEAIDGVGTAAGYRALPSLSFSFSGSDEDPFALDQNFPASRYRQPNNDREREVSATLHEMMGVAGDAGQYDPTTVPARGIIAPQNKPVINARTFRHAAPLVMPDETFDNFLAAAGGNNPFRNGTSAQYRRTWALRAVLENVSDASNPHISMQSDGADWETVRDSIAPFISNQATASFNAGVHSFYGLGQITGSSIADVSDDDEDFGVGFHDAFHSEGKIIQRPADADAQNGHRRRTLRDIDRPVFLPQVRAHRVNGHFQNPSRLLPNSAIRAADGVRTAVPSLSSPSRETGLGWHDDRCRPYAEASRMEQRRLSIEGGGGGGTEDLIAAFRGGRLPRENSYGNVTPSTTRDALLGYLPELSDIQTEEPFNGPHSHTDSDPFALKSRPQGQQSARAQGYENDVGQRPVFGVHITRPQSLRERGQLVSTRNRPARHGTVARRMQLQPEVRAVLALYSQPTFLATEPTTYNQDDGGDDDDQSAASLRREIPTSPAGTHASVSHFPLVSLCEAIERQARRRQTGEEDQTFLSNYEVSTQNTTAVSMAASQSESQTESRATSTAAIARPPAAFRRHSSISDVDLTFSDQGRPAARVVVRDSSLSGLFTLSRGPSNWPRSVRGRFQSIRSDSARDRSDFEGLPSEPQLPSPPRLYRDHRSTPGRCPSHVRRNVNIEEIELEELDALRSLAGRGFSRRLPPYGQLTQADYLS